MISDKLRPQPTMDGKMRPKFFIREDLKPAILEMETYHYPLEESGAMVNKDIPVKENDHFVDAVRYLFLSRAEPRKKYVRRERNFDAITGRALS